MTLAVCGFVLTAVMLDFSDGLLCVFSLTEGVTTMVKRSEQWSKPLLVDDDWGIVLSNIIQYHPISSNIFYIYPISSSNIFWDFYSSLWEFVLSRIHFNQQNPHCHGYLPRAENGIAIASFSYHRMCGMLHIPSMC